MSENELAIAGIIILFVFVACLYFSPEILDFVDKKKREKKKTKRDEIVEKDKKGFKEIFRDKILAPLAIGHLIFGAGYIFEYDPLIWIGIGLAGYGFFLMIREY